MGTLRAAGVPCAPVLDLAQVMAGPQFAAVGMLLPGPDGTMPLIGTPLRFDGERPPYRSPPAPALGDHSESGVGAGPGARASWGGPGVGGGGGGAGPAAGWGVGGGRSV